MLREKTVVLGDDAGRDAGKKFKLTEMPAAQAEEWFLRAMQVLARAGVEVPPGIFAQGALGFAAMGLGSLLTGVGKAPWTDLKPLLDEMWGCIRYISPNGTLQSDPGLVNTQVEEVSTRLKLREEVLSLHLGFSLTAKLSELKATASAMLQTLGAASGSTVTSLEISESSSLPN